MNNIVRLGRIVQRSDILRVRCLSSDYLDPLYLRRQANIENEWTELAKKQLKGEDPAVKLKWKTPEVNKQHPLVYIIIHIVCVCVCVCRALKLIQFIPRQILNRLLTKFPGSTHTLVVLTLLCTHNGLGLSDK